MNKIPYRYDIVGSFLRSERLKHARENFNNNLISKNELKKIENEELFSYFKECIKNDQKHIYVVGNVDESIVHVFENCLSFEKNNSIFESVYSFEKNRKDL